MADEIEQTLDEQGHRFFRVGPEPAWHKLGTNISEAPTARRAMVLAGQDHSIDKVGPLWVPVPDYITPKPDLPEQEIRVLTDPATGQEFRFLVPKVEASTEEANIDRDSEDNGRLTIGPAAFATMRGEDGKVLGTVGKGYGVVEPLEMFTMFDRLLEVEGGVKFQSAGVLKGGRWVFMTAKLPQGIRVFGKETHDLYLFAVNSYDLSLSFTVGLSATEIVCANTAQAALAGTNSFWKLRHTGNVLDSVDEIRTQLGLSYQYAEKFQDAMERLASVKFDRRQYNRMIDQLYPDRKTDDKRRQELRKVLKASYGSTSVDDGLLRTGYGAYSVFTESREWAPAHFAGDGKRLPNSLWISKGRTEDDVRTEQAWFGNVASDRQFVFDYLADKAGIPTAA
jgi:phage/plasmid-like protein (TIGR03299 family)